MKCISYSLFGYNRERQANCFDFASYLRGLMINVRMNRLLFPDWDIVLHLDRSTYEGFPLLFDGMGAQIRIENEAPLCKAMLWRLKPCFERNDNNEAKYTHVICRDVDSPPTYRDAQAVAHWIQHDKAAHAITDSISHTIPMMGGMIGFRPKYFTMYFGDSWENLVESRGIDYSVKGSDQTFINQVIYPKLAQPGEDSITQHYVLGMGNTWLSDYNNHIPDIQLPLADALKESNQVCGHIGAAGFYEPVMFKFLRPYWNDFKDLLTLESNYPNIFYWYADR